MWKYFVVLVLAFAGADTFAQEASPNQGLFGDWGGLRTRLYQQGFDFQFGYIAEVANNVQGGSRNLVRNADQVTLGTTMDLDKLLGLSGGTFQVTITERGGDNLSADANLETLQAVQEVYGRGQVWRWTEFYYKQLFLDGMLDVKLGRLPVGGDFMSFSCLFENLSFCGALPGNIVPTWYNWPVSQWAARVKVNVTDEWYAQIGAYQVNPQNLEHGNSFKLNNSDGTIGALIPAEVGWKPKFGKAGLPGIYRVGIWYDSSDQPDVFLASNNTPLAVNPGAQPLTQKDSTGGYLMLQQQVTGEQDSPRGLSLFANFVQTDRDTTPVDQLITLGLFYTGPFDARPQDDLGFAVGRTHVNSRVADGQSLQNAAGFPPVKVQHSEYPIEAYYSFNIERWLTLRPNVQYIVRPGGSSDNQDVVVLGLKASVMF